ncbi:MAG: hypothetical protein DRP26_01680, partial [Candidatus Zixiibacteriota bacterium]
NKPLSVIIYGHKTSAQVFYRHAQVISGAKFLNCLSDLIHKRKLKLFKIIIFLIFQKYLNIFILIMYINLRNVKD